ncbi:MAG: exo-alpha-sialidase [Duncaniella sp.]|nr:exo-alpha-sialidase [Duncaniella sp.]
MHFYKTFISAAAICCSSAVLADQPPFKIIDGLFDPTQKETMGLEYAPGAETVTVFSAADDTDHYANGVVMAAFKGDLYCMWQSSMKDEDAADTWVAYSRSTDNGNTWSAPMVLCPTIDDGYCASGGWYASENKLVGYINTRPKSVANSGGYTMYVESSDGISWTEPKPLLMADGTQLDGIFEQDPHKLPDGRIIGAAHFQPGLKLCPVYTDDPTGTGGWKKGEFAFTSNGAQSVELEPSFFMQSDGTLVMIMRDQKSSYFTLASTSSDRGETWTPAVKTNMPDSRAKQCGGNLPDGTAFMVNNPGRVTKSGTTWRVPLAITLSSDGMTFDRSYLLRSGNDDDYPKQRYSGQSKTLGYSYPKALVYGGYVYVSYSTNKDDAQYTRVPVDNLVAGIKTPMQDRPVTLDGKRLVVNAATADIEVYDLAGRMLEKISAAVADLSALPSGIYIVKITVSGETTALKLAL